LNHAFCSTLAAELLALARLERRPLRRYLPQRRQLILAYRLELEAQELHPLHPQAMRAARCWARGSRRQPDKLLALLIRSGFSRHNTG
jgi:hypothetical protein